MKRKSMSSILAITIAILAPVWLFAIITFALVLQIPLTSWSTLVCMAIVTIIAEIYLFTFRKKQNNATTESSAIGIIITAIAVIVSSVLNTVMTFIVQPGINLPIVLVNIIIIAFFIIALIWTENHSSGVTARVNETAQKIVPIQEISRKIGDIMTLTEDEELRIIILRLKEAVDYDSNISTAATAGRENQFNEHLDKIINLTVNNADRQAIINELATAEMIWKLRSNANATSR